MGKYIIYEGFFFIEDFVFFDEVFRNVIKYFFMFLKWEWKRIVYFFYYCKIYKEKLIVLENFYIGFFNIII